jgi:hypothetical protein
VRPTRLLCQANASVTADQIEALEPRPERARARCEPRRPHPSLSGRSCLSFRARERSIVPRVVYQPKFVARSPVRVHFGWDGRMLPVSVAYAPVRAAGKAPAAWLFMPSSR